MLLYFTTQTTGTYAKAIEAVACLVAARACFPVDLKAVLKAENYAAVEKVGWRAE